MLLDHLTVNGAQSEVTKIRENDSTAAVSKSTAIFVTGDGLGGVITDSINKGQPQQPNSTHQNTINVPSQTSTAAPVTTTVYGSPTDPFFERKSSKNVTALLGKTTYLNCRVKNLGNKTVS